MVDLMKETTIRKIYLVRTNDEGLWKTSSSGGIFWHLVQNIIDSKNGVCYGAKYDDNFEVVHSRAETLVKAEEFRGSKYLQSDMKNCYSLILDDLKNGRWVLFSGTPCQVRAIKNFIPDQLQGKLLLVDILCHGAPSPRIFNDYIKLQEKIYRSKASEIRFRGKKLKHSVQDMYIKFKSGQEYKAFGTQDIYYKLFFHELISRHSCHECPFANTYRHSDITISDYWGERSKVPECFGKKIGLSAVYINSDKGQCLYNESTVNLTVAESSIDICDQTTLHHPISESTKRDEFWVRYLKQGLLPAFEYYFGSYKKMQFMRIVKNSLNEIGVLLVIKKLKKWK